MSLRVKLAAAYAATTLLFAPATSLAVSYSDVDGWPMWIGRPGVAYLSYGEKVTMQPVYLPLSLIRTGRFVEIVREVEETESVTTHGWPSWIGQVVEYVEQETL